MGRPSRADQVLIAERRIKLIQMRRKKATWETIADELGYSSPSAACQDLKRFRKQRDEELAMTSDDWRHEELEHLEMLTRKAIQIMEAEQSKWVGRDDGKLEPDYTPTLQAIESLRRLSERRAKLLGIDAPTKVETDGQLKVVVEATDFNMEDLK